MPRPLLEVSKAELLTKLCDVMSPAPDGRQSSVASFVEGHSFAQPHFEALYHAVEAMPDDKLPGFLALKQNVRVLNTAAYSAAQTTRPILESYFSALAESLDQGTKTCVAEIEDTKFLASGQTQRSGWSSILTGGGEPMTYRESFAAEGGRAGGGGS